MDERDTGGPSRPTSPWDKSGWLVRIRYVSELMTALGRLGTFEKGRRFVWRGMRRSSYALESSLQRYLSERELPRSEQEICAAESRFLEHARSWGIGDIGGVEMDDLQLLAVMQHHGVPTRLMDFTSNPMTALWFACQADPDRLEDGLLLAVDVTDLRQGREFYNPSIGTWGGLESPLSNGLRMSIRYSAENNSTPILLESRAPDRRLQVQEGLFMLGAVPEVPTLNASLAFNLPYWKRKVDLREHILDARTSGRPIRVPFVAISIPDRIKAVMRTHLSTTYNRNRRYLFPDVDGLAEAIRLGDVGLTAMPRANASPENAVPDAVAMSTVGEPAPPAITLRTATI